MWKFLMTLVFCTLFAQMGMSQSKPKKNKFFSKKENLLIGKKWMVVDVKHGKKKRGIEVGEEWDFTVEKTFTIKKNDNMMEGGRWRLNGKKLILLVEKTSKDGEGRDLPTEHKIRKLKDDLMVLKFKVNKNKKFSLKRQRAKVYFRH